MEFRKLDTNDLEEAKSLFYSIFTQPPWNDGWNDPKQLDAYFRDMMCSPNSLAYGLFEEGRLIGASTGYIMHWWSGTEYYILEFFISTDMQSNGCGSTFLKLIEEDIAQSGFDHIFLQTERTVPAYGFYKKQGFTELADHVSLFKRL